MNPPSIHHSRKSLFFWLPCWGGLPKCMGRFRPPYFGTPQHNALFLLIIYKAILLAKNSGHSGYFAKIDVLHALHDSGYFANSIRFVLYKNTIRILSTAPFRGTLRALGNSRTKSENRKRGVCIGHPCTVGHNVDNSPIKRKNRPRLQP